MKTNLSSFRRSRLSQAVLFGLMLPSLLTLNPAVQANPSGGVVVHGAAEILSPENFPDMELDPAFLQIMQHSDKAIINWGDFSINAGEVTEFLQPSQTAAVLNRVISGNPSALMGTLKANGKVVLVNQNGIIVGPGGVIDAFGGAVLSTLDIDNNDFLNGGDDMYRGMSAAGVSNFGTIMSGGGDVTLLGNFIDNQGTIGAPDGSIALGAGGEILVHAAGESKISVLAPGPGGQTGINNAGVIRGGSAELKAHGNVYALAINNSGTIRATGSTKDQYGRITLTARTADNMGGGNIENTGEIKATNVDGAGGAVLVDGGIGSNVQFSAGVVDASGIGDMPGGTVTIFGETIGIDSTIKADGGDGGAIIIGSAGADGNGSTMAINVGANANISANGRSGMGGTVALLGDPSGIIGVSGRIEAKGATDGGMVTMQGGNITLHNGSTVDVSGGTNGGVVNLLGDQANGSVTVNGTVNASGGVNGGVVLAQAANVNIGATGVVDVSGGMNGGIATVDATNGTATINGTINANGMNGVGGVVNVGGSEGVNIGATGNVSANGAQGGGRISVDSPGDVSVSGDLSATSSSGQGGRVDVSGGQSTTINGGALIDASGTMGGGQINVGGGFQGNDSSVRNSQNTVVGSGAMLKADGTTAGDGGQVVVWADGDTMFNGEVSAQGLGQIGNGGFVEISGKQNLAYAGMARAGSVNGANGTLLFDPGSITVSDDPDSASVVNISSLQATLAAGGTDVVLFTDGTGTGQILFDHTFIDNGVLRQRDAGDTMDGLYWGSDSSLTVLAHGDATFLRSVQNSGTGSVNVVAGWDSGLAPLPAGLVTPAIGANDGTGTYTPAMTIDAFIDSLIADVNTYGNGGNVYINNPANNQSGNRGVAVGSALGETNVLGGTIFVNGVQDGNLRGGYGQIGYQGFADYEGWVYQDDTVGAPFKPADPAVAQGAFVNPTGNITVQARSGLLMISDPDRDDAYTMIGHGGSNAAGGTFGVDELYRWIHEIGIPAGNGDASGDIDVDVDNGSVVMQGGAWRGFTQIGHGGYRIDGDTSGDISVNANAILTSGGTRSNSHNRIGHGGRDVDGVKSGNIAIDAGAALIMGGALANGDGGLFTQVGHGGHSSAGNASGTIDVVSTGLVQISTARGGDSSGMIGHGGENAYGVHSGDITVQAGGPINMFAYNTDVPTDGGDDNFVQIGHGGENSDRTSTNDIQSRTTINNDPNAYDDTSPNNGGHSGEIIVTTTGGDIHFTAGPSNESYAHLGHGGRATDGSHSGNITATASGDIIFDYQPGAAVENDSDGSARSYSQLGHGGQDTIGNSSGNITVSSGGEILFRASKEDSYAQLGHGGVISASPNEVHATLSGDIMVDAVGDIRFYAGGGRGDDAFAQLGHGGRNADAIYGQGHNGNISVTSGGNIMFKAAPEDTTLAVRNRNHAMLGHGGNNSRGNHFGTIDVTSTGSVTLQAMGGWDTSNSGAADNNYNGAATGSENFAQIGHGGTNPINGSYDEAGATGIGSLGDSTIRVDAGGDISVISPQVADAHAVHTDNNDNSDAPYGVARATHAMIGHGGYGEGGGATLSQTGDIFVTSMGAIHIDGSDYDNPWTNGGEPGSWTDSTDTGAQIGHGGTNVNNLNNGEIQVIAQNDITLDGGKHRGSTMVGHGGFNSGPSNSFSAISATGDIEVVSSSGTVRLAGGGGTHGGWRDEMASVQIGHGGGRTSGSVNNNIRVSAGNNVEIVAGDQTLDAGTGDLGDGEFAMIGHGGTNNNFTLEGDFDGTIDVFAGNNILLDQGIGRDAYAKIGHGHQRFGGWASTRNGEWNGDINVAAGNNVDLVDGGMIGHADPESGYGLTKSSTGDTFIAVSRNDPSTTGSGTITTAANSKLMSGTQGFGTELRIYSPNPAQNALAEGTRINFSNYTRTPTPDGTRADEEVATEFTMGTGAYGEPSGMFTPEGTYSPSGFGNYTVFYSDAAGPVIPPGPPGGGGGDGPAFPGAGGGVAPEMPPVFFPGVPEVPEEVLPGPSPFDLIVAAIQPVAGLLAPDSYDLYDRGGESGGLIQGTVTGVFDEPATSAEEAEAKYQDRRRWDRYGRQSSNYRVMWLAPGMSYRIYSSASLFGVPIFVFEPIGGGPVGDEVTGQQLQGPFSGIIPEGSEVDTEGERKKIDSVEGE